MNQARPRKQVLQPGATAGVLIAALAGAGVLAAAGPVPRVGQRQSKAASGLRSAARLGPVAAGITVAWTGEQNGHLEPCGCAKPQLGGMVRRAGYLAALPPGPSLRLDNGDLTEARGRQDELKAETSMQLLNRLGYAAINLGESDLRLGLPYLQYLASSFQGVFLCANARDATDRPLFHEYLLREIRVGKKTIRIGIAGLMSEQFAPEAEALNPGLKIAPAAQTLDRLRPALEKLDFVIVMFHGGPDEARQLASGQGWINAMIVAHSPDDRAGELAATGGRELGVGSWELGAAKSKAGASLPPPTPNSQFPTPVFLTVGRDGKFLGLAQITAGAAGGRPRLARVRDIELGPETPRDPAARAIEAVYLQRVADEHLLAKVPRVPIPGSDHFTGSKACASCHPEAHRIWAASEHAHAWATLVHVGHQQDPDCVGCHVVGLEYQGGFQDAQNTPQLVNVGCENCHQAAGRHAASPASVRPPKIGPAACAACHVPDHSPGFDFTRYWAKIRH